MLEWLRKYFPSLNVVVNNAAVMHEYNFLDGQRHTDKVEEEIGINLTAQIKLIDELIPLLRVQRQAAIVNVTSAVAKIVLESAPVYCASKAGLEMFTKALRDQLRGMDIAVFEVIPPPVDTQMCKGSCPKISPEKLVEESLQAIKDNRYEIRAGATKLYYFLNWISPSLAKSALGRI